MYFDAAVSSRLTEHLAPTLKDTHERDEGRSVAGCYNGYHCCSRGMKVPRARHISEIYRNIPLSTVAKIFF